MQVVPEQELPDGHFPTCPYPNPEIRQVFEKALDMAKETQPDLLLATDPDCDRVGIAVRDNGKYTLMSGNEVGCLLLNYLLSRRQAENTLPDQPMIVKTIVTSDLAARIAQKYGCRVVEVPVSYTHLDVYKRQIIYLSKKFNVYFIYLICNNEFLLFLFFGYFWFLEYESRHISKSSRFRKSLI